MTAEKKYWINVFKRLVYVIFLLLGIIVALKLSVFYMPFLVAFIISLIIEPLIKYIMKKTSYSRRTSAIIIFVLASIIIVAFLLWLMLTLFSETTNLLQGLNEYFDKAYKVVENFISQFQFDKINLNSQMQIVLEETAQNIFQNTSNLATQIFDNLIKTITAIPSIAIYVGISIVALYFICVDKIYIIDQIEHHLPKKWVKKIGRHIRDLIKTLGGYLKAQATLIFTSFIVCLIGLYLFKIIGFNIEYPLLMAIFIGFVDALPILGSGTVMVPWAIACGLNRRHKLRNINNFITNTNVSNKANTRTQISQ